MQGQPLLEHVAHEARVMFRLHILEWLPGHVSPFHSGDSLHYVRFPGSKTGRAFDASRDRSSEARFARWLRRNYGSQMSEVIYNGRWTKVSIKDGKKVPTKFWGESVWLDHRDHVHVAV